MKTDENKTKQNIKKKIQCDQSCRKLCEHLVFGECMCLLTMFFLMFTQPTFHRRSVLIPFIRFFTSCWYFFFFYSRSFALFWCFLFICCSYWIDNECVAGRNHRSISQNDIISSTDKRLPNDCHLVPKVVSFRILFFSNALCDAQFPLTFTALFLCTLVTDN